MPLLLWLILSIKPETMAEYITACTAEGYFPDEWKRARLVLIPKLDDRGGLKGYRPLSVLSHLSKIFEHLIKG